MIVLASDRLLVVVDPAHGGEVVEILDRGRGASVLARPPFVPAPPSAGDLDEEAWTAAYRGGWQGLAPNAGNACRVDGIGHGFHGAASVGRFAVLDQRPDSVRMRWDGHGLAVERAVAVDGAAVTASARYEAATDSPVAMVAVEHVAFGPALAVPGAELRLPGGTAYELSERDGPARPPPDAPAWPEARLLDGGVGRLDRMGADPPSARYAVVAGLPEGWAEAENAAVGLTVRLEWDARALPHLWLWHEMRASAGLWRRATEILALEPASVPHGLGLARAVAEGEATVVAPGEPFATSVTLRLR